MVDSFNKTSTIKTKMVHKVYCCAVYGGSGSGKTTICKAVVDKLKMLSKDITVAYIAHDMYYKNFDHLTFEQRAELNFDHPDSLDTANLVSHIESLKEGKAIDLPMYDFTQHVRKSTTTHQEPAMIIVLEGILIMHDEKLRDLIDLKVFIDADADTRLIRRLKRDIKERGRTVDDICKQYERTVKPMYTQFVEPSKVHADIIVPNNSNNFKIDVIVDLLSRKLEQKAKDNNQLSDQSSDMNDSKRIKE